MKNITLLLLSGMIFFSMCSAESGQTTATYTPADEKELEGLSTAYFASGCFWCVEAIFESVKGVKEAVSGYAGGDQPNPTYRQVSMGSTDHAESVKVYYDPEVVSFETLVEVYYASHNPTTVNGQHPDYGKQYRSIAFYQNEKEKKIIEDYIAKLEASGKYDKPIATEVKELDRFWPAEDYHQNYEKKNPNDRYVQNVSIPRLRKFQKSMPEVLKKSIN